MTIGRNTMLERIERSSRSMPAIGVRYHATTIVTFYENGVTEITSGGYRTSSTKERLNRYLPSGWRIFQKDYMWMLDTPVGTEEFSDNSVYIDDETADSDAGREVQA